MSLTYAHIHTHTELIACSDEVVHRAHSLVRRLPGEPHVEYQERDWIDPFKRFVLMAPIVIALTQRLLRPGGVDDDEPLQLPPGTTLTLATSVTDAQLDVARRVTGASLLTLLRDSLDRAQSDVKRVLSGRKAADDEAEGDGQYATQYTSLAGVTHTSLTPTTFLEKKSLLAALKAQHPNVRPLTGGPADDIASYMRDERGARCPICHDRDVSTMCLCV
jgi:hypothetical protein